MKRLELVKHIQEKKSFLCVGLDPDMDRLPTDLAAKGAEGILEFNKGIVDATQGSCVAYKLNSAFYEVYGSAGWDAMKGTCEYISRKYPEQFVICDAKRGDIGNTSRKYAEAVYEGLGADAVTVAPYMGEDSVKPFLEYEEKWAIMLALTSNVGSRNFQTMEDRNGVKMFERVVKRLVKWGTPINSMLVVGATRGELIADVRRLAPRHFFLVPGVGAQGGSLEEVCRYGMIDEVGLLVNSSRGIIYAGGKEGDVYAAAGQAAAELAKQMEKELEKYEII